MPRPRPLADIPPLRSLFRVPEELLPPPGVDLVPHREGVRLAREGGDLYFVFRMMESASADGSPPDSRGICHGHAEARYVRYLSMT